MTRKTLLLAASLLFLYSDISWGYIISIAHMKNPTTGQQIVLFGDCHTGKPCTFQQQDIIRQAKVMGTKERPVPILVEDMMVLFKLLPYKEPFRSLYKDDISLEVVSELIKNPETFNGNGAYKNDYPSALFRDTECPLGNLYRMCYKKSVPVINIECRFAELASQTGHPISSQIVKAITLRNIEQIEHYDDGAPLNNAYTEATTIARNFMTTPLIKKIYDSSFNLFDSFLCKVDEQTCNEMRALCTVAQLPYDESLSRQKPAELFDLLGKIFTYQYRYLLDAHLLHQIMQHKTSPILFICAGAGHTERVQKVLERAGYLHSMPAIKTENPLDIQWHFGKYFYHEKAFEGVLRSSARRGNVQVVSSILKAEALANKLMKNFLSIDDQDFRGKTALMYAARTNNVGLISLLKNAGAQTRLQDKQGKTALMLALKHKAYAAARLIARTSPRDELNIRENKYGVTPLMIATNSCNDASTIHDLINNGADVDASFVFQNKRYTALALALANDNENVVRALREHGGKE